MTGPSTFPFWNAFVSSGKAASARPSKRKSSPEPSSDATSPPSTGASPAKTGAPSPACASMSFITPSWDTPSVAATAPSTSPSYRARSSSSRFALEGYIDAQRTVRSYAGSYASPFALADAGGRSGHLRRLESRRSRPERSQRRCRRNARRVDPLSRWNGRPRSRRRRHHGAGGFAPDPSPRIHRGRTRPRAHGLHAPAHERLHLTPSSSAWAPAKTCSSISTRCRCTSPTSSACLWARRFPWEPTIARSASGSPKTTASSWRSPT